MQLSLNKLLSYSGNKYIFAKASMKAIDKMVNIKEYQPEENEKVVLKALNLLLDDKIKFEVKIDKE